MIDQSFLSSMSHLAVLSDAESRSISPENFTGEKGKGGMSEDGPAASCARDLGIGWKISPFVVINAGETFTMADINGPGIINHIWLTPTGNWRFSILRIYWDDQDIPSVECPVGDFFANGWTVYAHLVSLAVCVNPGSAFNSYWQMPFHKRCKITMTNLADEAMTLYYQIDYTLAKLPETIGYFHAQFRRVNPLPYKQVYTILDGVRGFGHYVGTYLAWGVHNSGWWGEGEVKFYLDGDDEFPTICGTGTEDYFCGSYNFENKETGQYVSFCTPYSGLHQIFKPDGAFLSQMRFGMYRWHLLDPIRFKRDIRVTVQALGWRRDERYLPLQDDIASVAYWYQSLPTNPFPPLPDRDALEVI